MDLNHATGTRVIPFYSTSTFASVLLQTNGTTKWSTDDNRSATEVLCRACTFQKRSTTNLLLSLFWYVRPERTKQYICSQINKSPTSPMQTKGLLFTNVVTNSVLVNPLNRLSSQLTFLIDISQQKNTLHCMTLLTYVTKKQ